MIFWGKVKIFKTVKTVFLKTAKHDVYSGSCGSIACMNLHRRKVANGIIRWIVIAVYVSKKGDTRCLRLKCFFAQ